MLMNCPCCGGRAVVMSRGFFNELVAEHGAACLTMTCENSTSCGVMLFCHYDSTDYDTMLQKATEQWNRRSYGKEHTPE